MNAPHQAGTHGSRHLDHTFRNHRRPDGVSEVVGEMLMIGLVILLMGVFGSVVGSFLPVAHDPAVTILMTNDTRGNITLWHKGGDWVKSEDLAVIVKRENDTVTRIPSTTGNFLLVSPKNPGTFDLESNITIISGSPLLGNETIVLVTPHAQIFSGRVGS